MFKLFKSKEEKLEKKYRQLMSDWHKLSTINRSESDNKYAEAQLVLQEIEAIQNK